MRARRNVIQQATEIVNGVDKHNALPYAARHEQEVSDLRDEVLAAHDLGDLLLPGVQTEGRSQTAQGATREDAAMRLARILVRCALRRARQ